MRNPYLLKYCQTPGYSKHDLNNKTTKKRLQQHLVTFQIAFYSAKNSILLLPMTVASTCW